jgi:hypothetical protein
MKLDPVHDHPAGHGRAVKHPPFRCRQDEHVGTPAKALPRASDPKPQPSARFEVRDILARPQCSPAPAVPH